MSDPAVPLDPPDTGPGRIREGCVEVRLRLSTALGLDQYPGSVPGYGTVLAGDARSLALRHRDGEWRVVLTDDQGRLQHVLLARRRPTTRPPRPASGAGTHGIDRRTPGPDDGAGRPRPGRSPRLGTAAARAAATARRPRAPRRTSGRERRTRGLGPAASRRRARPLDPGPRPALRRALVPTPRPPGRPRPHPRPRPGRTHLVVEPRRLVHPRPPRQTPRRLDRPPTQPRPVRHPHPRRHHLHQPPQTDHRATPAPRTRRRAPAPARRRLGRRPHRHPRRHRPRLVPEAHQEDPPHGDHPDPEPYADEPPF